MRKAHIGRRKIPLTITRKDIVNLWDSQKGLCFWTQVPMIQIGAKRTIRHPQKVSIDRIDSTKGYEPENVVLACQFANYGKSDVDIKTFFEFLRTLRKTFTAITVSHISSETLPSINEE